MPRKPSLVEAFASEVIVMPGVRGQFIVRGDCANAFRAAGHDIRTASMYAYSGPKVDGVPTDHAGEALTALLNDDEATAWGLLYPATP